tara:strand:+ start:1040 stop:1399 length:360 start_codon:yes stop_codon:yes gene_type:complete
MNSENKLILGTLLGVVGFYVILGRFQKASYSNQVGDHPGDGIDTFSETGELSVSTMIDSSVMPDGFRLNPQEQETCEYLHTTLHNLEANANFADTQEELDELVKDMDMIYELKENAGCI